MSVGTQGPKQFQGLFSVIPFKLTADFASTVDGNEAAVDLTVAGAALGDIVLVAPGADIGDLVLSAEVTTAGVVTAVVANNTGGTIDPASQTITGVVLKPSANVFAHL
jgi:hypothetical protein